MKRIALVCLAAFLPVLSYASTGTISEGNTAFILIATAMVALMTPAGLALFYGGLSSSRNVLNTMGMSYAAYAVATIVWVSLGYALAFGADAGGFIGIPTAFFLSGIGITDVSGTIPTLLFVTFQGTFAAITVAIVSGSLVERIRFSTWVVFVLFWSVLVYAPLAHWVWGGGFLQSMGALDFAGGTVVHICAGVSGLVVARMLGKRRSLVQGDPAPSSIKLASLGAGLLWFGWFGFNAGSELAADALAANALLVTNIAASAGVVGWMMTEWFRGGKPTMFGLASGAVAGLVGITPAAGFVDTPAAIVIGLVAAIVAYYGIYVVKKMLNVDDALDAFGVHALAGLWGTLATGIFANPAVNSNITGGLLYGNPGQLWIQLVAALAAAAFAAVATYAVFKLVTLLTKGGRVAEEIEAQGIDTAYHREKSFSIEVLEVTETRMN